MLQGVLNIKGRFFIESPASFATPLFFLANLIGLFFFDFPFFAPVSRYHSYINSAKTILELYKGEEPFASFIKKQFATNKKYGSRDRKTIAHLCYCYFRLGKSLNQLQIEERIMIALFLNSSTANEIIQHLKSKWNENSVLSIHEKLQLIYASFDYKELFPFVDELSDGVEAEPFCLSHFVQPDLFLRIRPGMKETVLKKLTNASIDFEIKSDDCIALPNATKIDELLQLNKEAVVQDWSSQRVAELLQLSTINRKQSTLNVWDCCAASGGKSIMLYDLMPDVELTVSDIRNSILVNLHNRFTEAGIKKYNSLVLDLSIEQMRNSYKSFDLIIADVPCTGSGTWGRTPENLTFFKTEQIAKYVSLQKSITGNCISSLKPNGYLLYITCSVFKKENEEVVKFLEENQNLELIDKKILKGYEQKADSMFAALLKKH